MHYIDVLLLLPRRQDKAVYTYSVPHSMESEPAFGKRVLVPVAGRRQAGIIMGPAEFKPLGICKAIIKVLDPEPVLTPELLELAEWMAQYYATSLGKVLKGIIPSFLRHKKADVVLPLIQPEEFMDLEMADLHPRIERFMELLWEEGQISAKEAHKILDDQTFAELEENGWILKSQDYGYSRILETAMIVKALETSEESLASLCKKAPRQAEAYLKMRSEGYMALESARQIAGSRIIQNLQEKGLIQVEPLQVESSAECDFVLSDEQSDAVAGVAQGLASREYIEFLLWGITGSGKTEVYIHLALQVLESGKSVLVLVPEIALTRQLVATFASRIGDVAVLHSDMPALERYDAWMRIKKGEVRTVIGARSAVFAPLNDIGLIIIDEEQESSFKQDESPRYHVRDVARHRAQMNNSALLLGSATPSLETFLRAMSGATHMLKLSKRIGGGEEPAIIIDDLRRYKGKDAHSVIAPLLAEKIRERFEAREQTILFLNRRGYKPITLCRSCGRSLICPNCSVSLNFHRDLGAAICHYCGFQQMPGQSCEYCGSAFMEMAGYGTQAVEEEIRRMFPEMRVARLDTDSSRRRGEQERVLNAMKQHEIDILIGTQMVAKGLDFPMVSLVGVLGADQMLSLPDFRASERAFQLIVQAAGRAGRAMGGAEVVVQTYNAANPVIQMAQAQDYFALYMSEIKQRQLLGYPPFVNLLRVVISSPHEDLCQKRIVDIIDYTEEILDAGEEDLSILGPAPCPIYRIRNRYRSQFMVKSGNIELLSSLARYLALLPDLEDCRLEMDLNPLSLM